MSHLFLSDDLYEYMQRISLREHPIMRALRDETAKHPLYRMQSAPEQVQFLQMLLRLLRAKNVLELGTFTGYATLGMALALPEDGRIITCDRNQAWTEIGQTYWQKAQQTHKIDLRIGPALQTIQALLALNKGPLFDFIFIDADKTNYVAYYEYALQLIRPHGLIAIDNVFWGGKVLDADGNNGQTREIKRLNTLIQQDDRVEISLLTIRDGLFLIQPKDM
ncbi:MAG TPA: class I SAM-dependent methyltransferase [Legionellaceae bacterium]|nr:class I SAM-dependent methyltransferase [Legionellaceae bacterium]